MMIPFTCALVLTLRVETPPQQPSQSAATAQPPSEVARTLAAESAWVDVPVEGQVRREIPKDAPTFHTPVGETTAMLLRLPAYETPYLMTISSFVRGIGPTLKVFVPNGIMFDADFRALGHFGEEQLRSVHEGVIDKLVVDLMMGDKFAQARYLLLFTRGNQVQQRVRAGGKDDPASQVARALGLGKVERSLEATIYAATGKPTETDIARKLGGPWKRVEGANEAMLRQLLGAPSSVEQDRNATIWIYDKTAAGKVRVYIIDDVASLRRPK